MEWCPDETGILCTEPYTSVSRPATTEVVMAGIIGRISAFLKSPQGRRYSDQAKRMASDPRNRQRAQDMLRRFRGKR